VAVLDGQRDEARAQGRACFAERRWGAAYQHLASAGDALDAPEQFMLAMSAYLLGHDDDCTAHLEDTYHQLTRAQDPGGAARAAFWLAYVLFGRGEMARGGAWLARGQDVLERHGIDCVECGYLLVLPAVQQLYAGDGQTAERLFTEVLDVGLRFDDVDLITLGRLGHGQALVEQGRIDEGLPILDEAMVAVTADEASPVIAGLVYCAVIAACRDNFDVRRAQEWTAALSRWCDTQPELVPYRGQCQVHRVELMSLHGAWQDAMAEAGRARQRLSDPPGQPAVGAAIYQEAELHRLRGQLELAEAAYVEASRHGHDPHPGLARLRLAQGDVGAAAAGLRRALEEGGQRAARPRLLDAYVEIALAAGDPQVAQEAAEELNDIADRHPAPLLRALAAQAIAAVRLANGEPADALRDARRAWRIWHEVGAPYEAARARVLVGLACRALGDHDIGRLELEAAGRAFRQLGARSDLAALEARSSARSARNTGGLTPRELEVLQLVAEGRTNRSVAAELHLSEKTVARHLSNLYTKLGLSSRAAATAWAYEHDLR
jgi:DNA-binding CsgD family transcriptional regulator